MPFFNEWFIGQSWADGGGVFDKLTDAAGKINLYLDPQIMSLKIAGCSLDRVIYAMPFGC